MANESQREVWGQDEVAEDWTKTEPISDYATPCLLDALRLGPGERVLDVACGGGRTSLEIAKAVGAEGHVTAVDISQSMLALADARRREASLENLELVNADAQTDSFPGGPFDAVLSQFGIMFFDDPVEALTNVRRHLKPGGRAAFIVWQPEDRMEWMPSHIIARYLPPPEANAPDTVKRAASWGDPAYASRILDEAGFVEVHVEERNLDAELPPTTDLPASILTGVVDPEHRQAVLDEWRQVRENRTTDGVMRLDLRLNLVTGVAAR